MPSIRPHILLPLVALVLALPAAAKTTTWIDPFAGWAGPGGGRLYARVHHGKKPADPKPGEGLFKRLEETWQTLELDALSGAAVKITASGKHCPGFAPMDVTADNHGFVEVALPGGLHGPICQLMLTANKDGYLPSTATLNVNVWHDDKPGTLGLISDIDDTLTDSQVTHKAKLIYNTLFHSQYEVKVFPHSGEAVKAVSGGFHGFPARALFYLSGSPWALHSRIGAAFGHAGLPQNGVFILRRYSKESFDAYKFKLPHLQELFKAFPNHKWVLFGDTGEKDPEVYSEMSKEHPENIEHIYIHNVTKADANSARFTAASGMKMTVFNDWSEVVKDTQARGYVFGHAPAKTGTE
jgi:phosphatidate phosphatase APP1